MRSARITSYNVCYTKLLRLPPEDIAAIERAYQGLRGMYSGVEGVTTTAARIALAALTGG